MGALITVVVPFLVAVYTGNYGRWAWRNGRRGGAVGLFALAVLTFALPIFALWLNS